jgi:hypothetical protein
MKLFDRLLLKLPAGARPAAAHAMSLVLGLVLAVTLHYVLYRLGLPSKPFIYAAF